MSLRCSLLIALVCIVMIAKSALPAESQSTTGTAVSPVWKEGELAPPLPTDPKARAAAVREAAKAGASRAPVASSNRVLTYASPDGESTLRGVSVTPRSESIPSMRSDMGGWLEDLFARLRPPANGSANNAATGRPQEHSANAPSGAKLFTATTVATFDGIDDTGLRPPAPDIAVGQDYLVVVTTDHIGVMNRCGQMLLDSSLSNFFGGLPGGAAYYTPRVIYDEWDNRWMIVFIGTATNYSVSTLYFAHSVTSNPFGAWTYYTLPSPTFPGLKDLPCISATPEGVYLTWDRFNLGTFVFETANIAELSKIDLFNGGGVTIQMRTGMVNPNDGSPALSVRPAQMRTYSGSTYFVDDDFAGDDFLTLWKLTGAPGASVLTGYDIVIGAYIPPPDVAQPDATLLDTGDCRVVDAVYSSGHVYEAHGESIGGHPSVTASFVDAGTLAFAKLSLIAGAAAAKAYGAIDIDDNDRVCVVYSTWSNVRAPSVDYEFLQFLPPAGLSGGTIANGQDSFNSGSQPYRWGPYSGCARDPVDGRTMWMCSMYASNSPLNSWTARVGAATLYTPGNLEVTTNASYYYTGGFVGGPFTSDTFDFTLDNTGQTAVAWHLTGVPFWVTALPSDLDGELLPGASHSFDLQLSPAAYTLGEGVYSSTIGFSNCTGTGDVDRFIGLGIGRDGSCPGGEIPLYPKSVLPTLSDINPQPGMYITAIEHLDVCSVDVTAELIDIPQSVYARIYEANGVSRGALLAETLFELVVPGEVRHSIPIAAALEPCHDYEVSVEFTGNVQYDTYNELSLTLPNDVGKVVRLRNASQAGNASAAEAAQIQLVTAVTQCENSSIVDLGGSKSVAGDSSPDTGIYVQPQQTVRLCTVGMNLGAATGTKVTARVYASTVNSRDYLVAEGSAIVSLPYLNYVDVPVSAQLIAGYEYDVAVQVEATTFFELNGTGSTPYLVDGAFKILSGENDGVSGAYVPTLKLGWTSDRSGATFSLAKQGGPPPLHVTPPLIHGAFITSLTNRQVYSLGVFADIPEGDFVTARVFPATGTSVTGPALVVGSVLSNAAGPRWHDIPLTIDFAAATDYDIRFEGSTATSAPCWLDTSGLPFSASGIQVRNGERDGLASYDRLIYMRLNGCTTNATAVPGRVPTPMFLSAPAPNPATARVTLRYAVDEPGPMNLSVFDVAGHRVETVVDTGLPGMATIDTSRMASGVYFVKLATRTKSISRKLVVTH